MNVKKSKFIFKASKFGILSLFFTSSLLFSGQLFADAIDDATDDDIADLCSNSPANELFKIANKANNAQSLRRAALTRMVEVSQECSGASAQRLKSYHQKLISAGHKLLSLSEVETRRVAIEGFNYVILQPASVQPSQGSINRGQSLANVATGDSDANIRLWALEALVTLNGDASTVENALIAASSDSDSNVSATAADMLAELFSP